MGTIDSKILKLRAGSYFSDWLLDTRTRSERGFIQVVAEAYVRGVSTRRVEGLVETLGVASLAKSPVSELAKDLDGMVADFKNRPLDTGPYTYVWADALTMKVREGGRIVNIPVSSLSVSTVRETVRSSASTWPLLKTEPGGSPSSAV